MTCHGTLHRAHLRRSPFVFLVAAFALVVVPACGAADSPSPAAPATPAPATSTSAAKGTRTLYLVRHGAYDEADPRDERVGRGLLPIGVAQARLLGARLRALPFRFDAVLASPFTRARETAAVLADDLGMAVEVAPDLAECTPPTRRRDIMAQEKPEDLAACAAQLDRLAARLFRPADGPDRRELVVAHGNVIRSLVVRALDVDRDAWLVMGIGHASLTVIAIPPDGLPRIVSVGDAGHLPPSLQTGAVGNGAHDLLPPVTVPLPR